MAKILYRTKGNASPKGKPRVYFTCHPEDFDKYFNKICEDIFATHDCAIFYKEDMNEAIARQDRATDLESHNLIVVPVTLKLLTTPNPAMDDEIPYAMEKKIPILPFMMESDIRDFYVKKFGQRQSLNPYSTDSTEISYEEKLKKHLEAVLVSDEMARRIRAEFDAYIFLSYRKMDRGYANELMKMIHSHPQCRDIAIWYDEFLTPGESFRENIQKALKKSKIVALLVTPNLLEEPDGKPNFVMREEYPAAKKARKIILPAEMKTTDKNILAEKFKGIGKCVNPRQETFKTRLLKVAQKLADRKNDDDPMHHYLIGLAYLEGIDMETNRRRGVELITLAAKANLPEAMERLYWIYEARGEYRKAGTWAKRLFKHYLGLYGPKHPDTLEWMGNVAYINGSLGKYEEALEQQEKVYALHIKASGAEHPQTMVSLYNLSWLCDAVGDYERALELCDKIYAFRSKTLGTEHPDTLRTMSHLAKIYSRFGENETALELCERVYHLRCEVLGEEHPETLVSMNDLAVLHDNLRHFMLAVEFARKAYDIRCKISGEEHPETLTALGNLATSLSQYMLHSEEAFRLSKQAYDLRHKVLGEKHPNTLISMANLALAYCDQYDYTTALELCETAYTLAREELGEKHPVTLGTMYNLAGICHKAGDSEKCWQLNEQRKALSGSAPGKSNGLPEKMLDIVLTADLSEEILEKLRRESGLPLEENHPSTLFWLNKLAKHCESQKQWDKYVALTEKLCVVYGNIYGEKHQYTLQAMGRLARGYDECNEYNKELTLRKTLYNLQLETLGWEHPETLTTVQALAHNYRALGAHQKALELLEKLAAYNKKNDGEIPGYIQLDIANTYRAMGELEKALELYDRLFECACEKECLFTWLDLVSVYEYMGQYRLVLKVQEAIYEYWLRNLGEDNVGLVAPLNNMAATYDILGEHEKARQLREKAQETERRARVISKIKQLEKKVSATYGTDAIAERMELLRELHTIQCEYWGAAHNDSRITLSKLMWDYYELRQYREAAQLCEKLYEAECEALGEEHPDAVASVSDLMYLHSKLEDYQTAQKWARKLYFLRHKLLGRDHSDTLRAARDLQALWQKLGLCRACGGAFTEANVCSKCGRRKDY